jgi:hypothetical protein
MLEARVQELERLIPFLRKEAVKKEAAEKKVVMMMTPSAPSDFLESSVGSSVPFISTIYTSTRTLCSSTSKTSSRMKRHRLTTW